MPVREPLYRHTNPICTLGKDVDVAGGPLFVRSVSRPASGPRRTALHPGPASRYEHLFAPIVHSCQDTFVDYDEAMANSCSEPADGPQTA
jgi:hypothetical protein